MSVQVDVPANAGRLCIAMNCSRYAKVTVQRDDRAPLPYCPRDADDRIRAHRLLRREIAYTDSAKRVLRKEGIEVIT